MDQQPFRYIRLTELLFLRGVSRSQHYLEIADGLWTKPVKLSDRLVAWPLCEIELQNQARAASGNTDELRELVKVLEAERFTSFQHNRNRYLSELNS